MGFEIHPTAIVDPAAVIGEGTKVGPGSIIGPHVVIGKECTIRNNVIIEGHTRLGDQVQVHPFSVIGGEPQHLGYRGEPTEVKIGNRVTLREMVTVNRGTSFGSGVTSVGDDCFIMAYCHVAHDCEVGRNVILANNVQIAGHVLIEDHVMVGGCTPIIQFNRIGRYAYIGAGSVVRKDIFPFMTGKGAEFEIQGVNAVGLSRKGFSKESIQRIRQIFKVLYKKNLPLAAALVQLSQEMGDTDEVNLLRAFARGTKSGLY